MEIHVVFEPKGWRIKPSKQSTVSTYYTTKQEAVNAARQLSIEQQCELVIHNKNGQISRKDSHRNDSAKSKG